jgi:two-component system sensor histidine kinase/response regulator
MNTPSPRADRRLEILIAEDSPTQAQRLQHILEQRGYHVTAAANGRLALDAARAKKPALVISDVVMPEMDGYELCLAIKADPNLTDVPVILVTTLSDPQDVIRGLECRADNFILKPFDEGYLLSRLQYVLVNREMRQAEQPGMGLEIYFNAQRHFITADRLQILNLLLSTYDAAIQQNRDLQAANRELDSANKELEAFSYSVSHDLRAPVRHIDGYAKLLIEEYADQIPAGARQFLDKVHHSAQRLGHLIDDLLAFSRLSRQPLAKRTVNLATLVQQTIEDLDLARDGRKLDLRIAPLPHCAGDPSLLRQVFTNLLSNALKFSRQRDPAIIEISSTEADGEVTVTVRDNGVGFDMKYAPRIFGVFHRLHREEDFEGTGVGLSIVQRIVNRHGGRIWVDAKLDEGATFSFTLPAA